MHLQFMGSTNIQWVWIGEDLGDPENHGLLRSRSHGRFLALGKLDDSDAVNPSLHPRTQHNPTGPSPPYPFPLVCLSLFHIVSP